MSITHNDYHFICLAGKELDIYNPNLKLFEIKMSQKYPLGNDFFRIDHGHNYLSFFKRLGKVYYFIIQHIQSKLIIGTACAILRKINNINFWYLCDLKIDQNHRGQNLTYQLIVQMFDKLSSKCDKGYFISMDPSSLQILHIFKKLNKDLVEKKLLIYSVSSKLMTSIEKYFNHFFGNISYLSLGGTKDLILESTNQPIPLYHLQHGPCSALGTLKLTTLPCLQRSRLRKGRAVPILSPESTIMFCLPDNSPLVDILEMDNIKTDISATIISWNMDSFDWHQILTSNI